MYDVYKTNQQEMDKSDLEPFLFHWVSQIWNHFVSVSESMAQFLVAEKLSQKSTSESQIERALERAEMKQHDYNANRITSKSKPGIGIGRIWDLLELSRLRLRQIGCRGYFPIHFVLWKL